MLYAYLLSASALAVVSLGALLYTVAGHGEQPVDGTPAPTSVDQGPEDLSARHREHVKLTQEALRGLGYAPGPSDGIMGSGTAAALRAFQRREGLLATGRANPETLSGLRIEDRRLKPAP